MFLTRTVVASVVAVAGLLAPSAHARQACPGYWESMNTLPGADGEITAACVWDSDGPGPATAQIVMGGNFFRVLNTPCTRVAMFDGSKATALGTNLDDPGRGFLVYQDQLFAIKFQNGRPLQRWNGFSWQGFGTSVQINPTAAIVFSGELIVGGWKEIRRWTGSDWVTLGAGLNSHVDALAEFNGQLVAGGRFIASGSHPVPFIGLWDGTSWSALGGGSDGPIDRMAVANGMLWVAGNFSHIGGVSASGAAVWDGTDWAAIPTPPNYYLAEAENTLFCFSPKVSRFDNGHWQDVGSLDHCTAVFEQDGAVSAFGGYSRFSNTLLRLNGDTWQPAMPGDVNLPMPSIASVPEGVAVENSSCTLGGQPSSGLLLYSDGVWSDFPGVTVSGPAGNLRSVGDTLYAWGQFTRFGDTPVNTTAARRRNGVWEYSPIPGIESVFEPQDDGSILFDANTAIFEMRDDQVVQLGGPFGAASGLPRSLVKWQGHPVVVLDGARQDETSGDRYHCWLFENEEWSPFGVPNQQVTALRVHTGVLYGAVMMTTGPHVASWSGSTWQPVGGAFQAMPSALCVIDGQLTALGSFTVVDGLPCNAPAKWTGDRWVSISPGTSITDPHAIAQRQDRLFMLTNACPTSYGIAAWVRPYGPIINLQPADANVCIGGSLDTSIDACGDDLQYAWLLNDSPLEDGVLPTGAVVSGAATASLHIDQITAAELGLLRCRVSNEHGTLDSDTVTISTCIADFDCSGFGDTDDFDAFVHAFESGEQRADVDGSGFVDTDDFDFYVHAFEAGCP